MERDGFASAASAWASFLKLARADASARFGLPSGQRFVVAVNEVAADDVDGCVAAPTGDVLMPIGFNG
jgi:hypothetical protein